MSEKEILIDIPGFEGLYQASSFGKIKSLEKKVFLKNSSGYKFYPEKYKSHHFNRIGYHQVSLSKDGKKKTFRVNRLIAICFHKNPDNLPQVNHKDGDKNNNSPSNLEWCSSFENNKHARDNNLNNNFGKDHHAAKLNDQDVINIRIFISQ